MQSMPEGNLLSMYRNIGDKEFSNIKHTLNDLHTKIDTRSEMVDKSMHEISKKNLYIHLLWVLLYVIAFLVIPWVFYMGGILSFTAFITILYTTFFLYIAYVAYKLNNFFYKKRGVDIPDEIKQLADAVGDEIYKEGRRLEKEARKYVGENCKCKK